MVSHQPIKVDVSYKFASQGPKILFSFGIFEYIRFARGKGG